jgi:2-C-methyl-D-erythritol 2,4-cyclodiphosphate synthase
LADAIYSALGLPDIGTNFPPQDPKPLGLASRLIVAASLAAALKQGLKPVQVSAVVTLDSPKLSPFHPQLIDNLAELLNLEPELVGLSFKTSEGLAPDHIQCRGIVVLA